MWQKCEGKFHLLLNYSSDLLDGRFIQTGCHDLIQVHHKKVFGFVMNGRCPICEGVWRLVCTSVDDAKQTLKNTENITVLHRASELTKSTTLKKAIEVRIRKLEKV